MTQAKTYILFIEQKINIISYFTTIGAQYKSCTSVSFYNATGSMNTCSLSHNIFTVLLNVQLSDINHEQLVLFQRTLIKQNRPEQIMHAPPPT